MQQLTCQNCRAKIPTKNINIQKVIAKCDSCGHVFDFEKMVKKERKQRREILLPTYMDVLKLNSQLEIDIKWRSSMNKFLVFFAVCWNAIMFVIVISIMSSGNFFDLLPVSIHLAVGIGLIYYIIAMYFNTSKVMVNTRYLTIKHEPIKIPFYKGHDIRSDDIEQVYVDEYVSSRSNKRPNYAFRVNVLLKDQQYKPIVILKGFKYPEQALYVEQEVERFLRIEDRKVKGEIA